MSRETGIKDRPTESSTRETDMGLRARDYNGHTPAEADTPEGAGAKMPLDGPQTVADGIRLAYESGRAQGQLDILTGEFARRLARLEERLDAIDLADRRAFAEGVAELEETVRKLAGVA